MSTRSVGHEAGRHSMHGWLDALCRGVPARRRVTLHSERPFRESLSFANRRIRIADQGFGTGLAMLTDGSVDLCSDTPMVRFRARVGLDDNAIARRMVLASVVFSVEAEGRELWQSSPMAPADAAQAVDLVISGARRLTLKATMVSPAARALTSYAAHADFADASVELADGTAHPVARALAELRLEQAATHPPFSFRLGERSSAEFFRAASRDVASHEPVPGERVCVVRYRDAVSGMACRLEARQFSDFSAVEWIAYFANDSDRDTPLLADVRALDLAWPAPAPARLHGTRGSDERPDDFEYVVQELGTIRSDLRTVRLDSGEGGRSSVSWLPFMNLETGAEGLVIAIGWSGQWSAEVGRDGQTGSMRLRAGMDGISLRLRPGESIRTPRILLLHWQGEPVDGNNLLRRYLRTHGAPRGDGRELEAPACLATWGGQPTPKHLACIKTLADQKLAYDCYWVDAGWYGTSATPCPDVFSGEWWKVGDWRVNPHYHGQGLKPLSDAIHASGMKFLLWLEPERALHGTPVTLEHPDWFLSRSAAPRQDGEPLLLDLGHPDARRWAVETVAALIEKDGVDWYRQDFNMEPMPFWQAQDGRERQGLAQIRHIEGLYAFWDELRRRFPRLNIDNCASGGRRIDLETVTRSVPLWRSDYGCFTDAHADGLQVHAAGLTCWVPIHAGGCVCPPGDTYYFRSNLSAALVEAGLCSDATRVEDLIAGTGRYPWEWYRRMLADFYRARPFFAGDFYPLTPINPAPTAWLAYQLHRPDLDKGLIVAFRRAQSPHPTAVFRLKGLTPERRYRFADADSGLQRAFPAGKLDHTGIQVSLPERRACCLLFYEAIAGKKPTGGFLRTLTPDGKD